jgi:hypothetical protein
MGGSFESGAGDDPNDLFANNDDADEEEVTEEEDVQPEQADEIKSEGQGTAAAASGESEATEASTGPVREEDALSEPGSTVMLDIESRVELDAARLAREFVPDTYDKPHAWALGRDGVNDGRAEKKTFFLQSSVLNLEAACSQEVNESLDGDVPLTDLRELALILAYHQPELLAEAAREWGAESA